MHLVTNSFGIFLISVVVIGSLTASIPSSTVCFLSLYFHQNYLPNEAIIYHTFHVTQTIVEEFPPSAFLVFPSNHIFSNPNPNSTSSPTLLLLFWTYLDLDLYFTSIHYSWNKYSFKQTLCTPFFFPFTSTFEAPPVCLASKILLLTLAFLLPAFLNIQKYPNSSPTYISSPFIQKSFFHFPSLKNLKSYFYFH